MKKILAIIEILPLCLLLGCVQQLQQGKQVVASIVQTTNDDNPIVRKIPFSKVLMYNIQQSISDTNHRMQSDMYDLWFAKTDGDCFIVISTTNSFHSKHAKGYYLIDDKLIVYYGTDVTCGAIMEGRIVPFINGKNKVECNISCLIDTTLLLKDCPADYPDENSEEGLYMQFDPYGKIFKVHNCDSLEMIYVGCL